MYVPPHFAETDIPALHAAMRGSGLVTLVTMTEDGMIASHLPVMLSPDPAPYGTLIGHLAHANPQTKGVLGDALVIFQGPEGYITPSYYATKRENAKVVPTWNYTAIHAYGTLRFVHEPDRLLEIVTALTQRHETPRAEPWAVTDAPADFVQGMLKGIVGLEVTITPLEGKRKMSQNRPASDIEGVISGLRADGRADLAEAVDQAALAAAPPRSA